MNDVLERRIKMLEELATKELGLDFFPIMWEIVPEEVMLEVMCYGLPSRIRHWSYGQSYEYQKTQGEMGASKVYELVLNNDPAFAFLLDSNSNIANSMVAAHVLGHVHFFKNNYLFKQTDRKMVYHAAERASRVEEYITQFGLEEVEKTMNIALAMDKNINWKRGINRTQYGDRKSVWQKRKVQEFDDMFGLNKKPELERVIENDIFPPSPEEDLLWFFANYARLEPWQKDIFEIIREESFYFYPQYNTQIINEGFACVSGDTLVPTEQGILQIKDIVLGDALYVDDNEKRRQIVGKKIIGEKECKKIITKRGYELCGANNHRVLCDNKWRQLDELEVGQRIDISLNNEIWSNNYVQVDYKPKRAKKTLLDISRLAGVAPVTIARRRMGLNVKNLNHIDSLIKIYEAEQNDLTLCSSYSFDRRKIFLIPDHIDEKFGRFLGLLIGDGHISRASRSFGFTSGDLELAEEFRTLICDLFATKSVLKKDENRYRIICHSEGISDFLINYIGCKQGVSARKKDVPSIILQSPKSVMSSFISGLFDADGCAHKNGITFVTASKQMAKLIQTILVNYNILSSKYYRQDETYAINIFGLSAKKFSEQIGFGLNRKQNILNAFIQNKKWFKKEKSYDEIKHIESLTEIVYDISVEESNRYVANGLINHNSFFHAELMYLLSEKELSSTEYLEFVKIHERVIQPGNNKLNINPYFLGFTILNDIRAKWDKKHKDGESELTGIQKILKVVELEDDISFLRNYLTQEIVDKLKMFVYIEEFDHAKNKFIEIKSTRVEDVVEYIAKDIYNYRAPIISINAATPTGIELVHQSREVGTLDPKHLEKVMGYIYEIWPGIVDLETIDNHGEIINFTFDEFGMSFQDDEKTGKHRITFKKK